MESMFQRKTSKTPVYSGRKFVVCERKVVLPQNANNRGGKAKIVPPKLPIVHNDNQVSATLRHTTVVGVIF